MERLGKPTDGWAVNVSSSTCLCKAIIPICSRNIRIRTCSSIVHSTLNLSYCNAPPPRVVARRIAQLVVLTCVCRAHVQQQLGWPRGPSGQTSYASSHLFYCPANHALTVRASSTAALVALSCPHSHSLAHPQPHSHTPNNALELKLALNNSRVCARARVGVRFRARSSANARTHPSRFYQHAQPAASSSVSLLVLVYHLAVDSRVSRAPGACRALRPWHTALRSRSSPVSRPPLASSNRRLPRLRVWRTSSIATARIPTRYNWPPDPTPRRPCASVRTTSRPFGSSPPLSPVAQSSSLWSFSKCDVTPG